VTPSQVVGYKLLVKKFTVTDCDSSRDIFGINSPRENPSNDHPASAGEIPATNPMSIDQPLSSTNNAAMPEEIAPLTAPWHTNELLPPQVGVNQGKKTLILDLDETLVHSSFVPTEHCDITLTVDIEGTLRTIYVAKRPHVDEFLLQCGELFEVVVFTASLAKYAGPLLDLLDTHKVIDHRLFRESCTSYGGIFVKDLFRMGRPLTHLLIIDNSPHSYIFNPENALPCESWFDDQTDHELLDLLIPLKRLSDPKVDNIIKELKRPTPSEPFEEEVGERPTAQDSVSQDECSENEEVTASVESENEGGGDGYEDGGQNGSWNT
jgi:RNA polymerase II subunit A small phosphatase-like protein